MQPIQFENNQHRLSTYPADFLLTLFDRMLLVREFEEQVKFLFLAGEMPGTIHQCQGQEASAVGVCAALNSSDYITSTHRPHGHALAKGLTPFEILTELFGKGTGCCKGKGGSMHIGNIEKGMPPAIAIVAGGIPVATGMGLAIKMQQSQQVVACFFGDGATSEGAFHEGVNMGAIWNLPVIFACENNQYGASTHFEKVTRMKSVVERSSGYGIISQTVDGNDILAVYEATRRAAQECRAGNGPVLLELLTYRSVGHSRRDTCNYQPVEERHYWSERDPIRLFGDQLISAGITSQKKLDEIHTKIEQSIKDAIELARNEPEPNLIDLTADVYFDANSTGEHLP